MKVGGRALVWAMYFGLIRPPPAIGGGCRSTARRSQVLRSEVFTLVDQSACALATAGISRSSPRPVSAESATIGAPFSCPSIRSAVSWQALSRSLGSSTRSHLASTNTSARPSRSTRSAICTSWVSNGWVASITRITTSAKVMARMASWVESFSSASITRALRRRPAVSTSRTGRPSQSQSTEIASRVMPASGPVSRRSSPISWLTSVDLPAFGRPTMAIFSGEAPASASASSSAGRAASSASNRSDIPSPCSAEIATASPKPSLKASSAPTSPALPSALLATSTTGLPRLRSTSPNTSSNGVTPSRASNTNSAMSASSSASSVWRRMRASRLSPSSSSNPAVSISSRSMSPSRPVPKRRSRVTPGRSSTSASLRPASRLNRVDLPTLGRPTMAILTMA